MLKYLEPLDWLPTAEELPECDGQPVDSELQERLATLLSFILAGIFKDRSDWFFGIDMGLYYNPDEPPVAPDGFLSIGVESVKSESLRPSYVLWEEKGIIPQFVLEVVSKKYRAEYTTKKDLYQSLGVLYYIVYNPLRKRKNTLEVYRLVEGQYVPVIGNPVWMPEIGLGIGKERHNHQGRDREWLFWYNENNDRYPTPQEQIEQEYQQAQVAKQKTKLARKQAKQFEREAQQFEQEAQQAQQQAQQAQQQAQQAQQQAQQAQQQLDIVENRSQKLADRLRQLGIDPDEI